MMRRSPLQEPLSTFFTCMQIFFTGVICNRVREGGREGEREREGEEEGEGEGEGVGIIRAREMASGCCLISM